MPDGGCACGALRYHVEDLGPAWFCHCRACQRSSGAPAVAWVAAGGLATRGASGTCPDASHGARVFCPACGTAPIRRGDSGFQVAIVTLDDAAGIAPVVHLGVEDQQPWLKTWDGLPRVEGTVLPEPLPRSWRPGRDPALDRSSEVTLRPIDTENRIRTTCLLVAGSQMRFVAPNAMTLLQQLAAECETWLRAVYAGGVPVGLVLVDFPAADEDGLPLAGRPFLWRFMVDEHYQGLGYGARAMAMTLDEMRRRGHDAMFVSVVPGTGSPLGFYEHLGFVDTGVVADGEIVLRIELSPPPSR